jgi:hypothetical protein
MSVSYVDMHGRTIATALAGNAPTGIKALNLNDGQYPGQAGTAITRNMLNGNANAIRGNSIEALTTLLVPVTGTYQFNYSLVPPILSQTTCSNTTVCYDCLYTLQIAVTDESGTYPPVIRQFDNVSLSADNNCGAGPAFEDDHTTDSASVVSGNTIQFSATLQPGSYSVRKTLTVSQNPISTFETEYLQNGLCKTEQQLIDSVYQVLEASSGCNMPSTAAPCQTCLNALGTYAQFKANYLGDGLSCNPPTDSAIHALYTADSANCTNMCSNGTDLLSAIQSQMLGDMMPWTGQYAQNPVSVSHGTMFDKYNIFWNGGFPVSPSTSIR